MRIDRWIIGFLVMAFGMSFFFMCAKKKNTAMLLPEETTQSEIKETKSSEENTQTLGNATNGTDLNTSSLAFTEKVRALTLPSFESVRDELQSDTHRVPPSVLKASNDIKDVFKKVTNLSEASQLMDFLKKCADNSHLQSAHIQVVCLNYAKKLGASYSSLYPTYEYLESQSTPQVQEIHDFINDLDKASKE